MRSTLRLLVAAIVAACLSGCMALALAPIANSFTDKPVSWQYTTTAKKPVVFNAALKALNAKGIAESVDREAGSIRGTVTVTGGQAAYNVTLSVEDRGGRTSLRVDAKLEGMMKFDLKNSSDLANEIVKDIERQIGATLERT
ncbi:MAG: hypothetical protein JWQ07_103 [Ramlibacter sp.]|nr:hypothetical protein [Ramlibacter sp.]